jgi:hypothetical protein
MSEWPDEINENYECIDPDYKYPPNTPELLQSEESSFQDIVHYEITGLFKTSTGDVWYLTRIDRAANRKFQRYIDEIIKNRCDGFLKIELNQWHDKKPFCEWFVFNKGRMVHILDRVATDGREKFHDDNPILSEICSALCITYTDNFPIDCHDWERIVTVGCDSYGGCYFAYPFIYANDKAIKELSRYLITDLVDECIDYHDTIDREDIDNMIKTVIEFYDEANLRKLFLKSSLVIHDPDKGDFITNRGHFTTKRDRCELTNTIIIKITDEIVDTLFERGVHCISIICYAEYDDTPESNIIDDEIELLED